MASPSERTSHNAGRRGGPTPLESFKEQRLAKAREELREGRTALETLKQAPEQNADAIVRMDAFIEKLTNEIRDLENELNPQKLSELERKRRKNAEAAERSRAKKKTLTEYWMKYAMENVTLLSQHGIEPPMPPEALKSQVGWMRLLPQAPVTTTSNDTQMSDGFDRNSSESPGALADALDSVGTLVDAMGVSANARAIKTEGPSEDFIIMPPDQSHNAERNGFSRTQYQEQETMEPPPFADKMTQTVADASTQTVEEASTQTADDGWSQTSTDVASQTVKDEPTSEFS